ncbi:MAG: thioredoxin family protein [Dehalococcoidia bacterium]
MLEKVNTYNFGEKVLQSQQPVFACFTAPKCDSCFANNLIAELLAKEYEKNVKFVQIDAEQSEELMERYHIRFLPAIMLFKHSIPVKTLLGFYYLKELKNILNSLFFPGNARIKRI